MARSRSLSDVIGQNRSAGPILQGTKTTSPATEPGDQPGTIGGLIHSLGIGGKGATNPIDSTAETTAGTGVGVGAGGTSTGTLTATKGVSSSTSLLDSTTNPLIKRG